MKAGKQLWDASRRQPAKALWENGFLRTVRSQHNLAAHPGTAGNGKQVAAKATPPPLSALPTGSLIRSLLLSTVSSHPILLRPSLAFLTWLTCSSSRFVFNVDKNPILHSILKSTFYKQFCAGESESEAKQTLKHMKDLGFKGTLLTYAKETVFDNKTRQSHGQGVSSAEESGKSAALKEWSEGTLRTVALLGDGDQIAIKLTGAGPEACDSLTAGEPSKAVMDSLHEICRAADEKNVRVVIDAESQHYQKGIFKAGMELAETYNRNGVARVFNSYQAYLKSTPSTLEKHMTHATEGQFVLGIKLVRGAYMASDERSLIHDCKQDTDNAYNAISQGVLKRELGSFGGPQGQLFPPVYLYLASHNRDSLVAAHKTHQARLQQSLPTVPLDFAQLHGMSDNLSLELVQMGVLDAAAPGVYKCSTWGTMGECLAYLMRRAAENRDAVSRTRDEHRALKKEVARRIAFN